MSDTLSLTLPGVSRRRFMASVLGGMASLASLDSEAVGRIADEFCESGGGKWRSIGGKLLVRCYLLSFVNEFWSREIIELPEGGIRVVEVSAKKQDAKLADTTPIEWKITRGPESAILQQMLHPLWNWSWQATPMGGFVVTGSEVQVYARQASKAEPIAVGGAIVGVQL